MVLDQASGPKAKQSLVLDPELQSSQQLNSKIYKCKAGDPTSVPKYGFMLSETFLKVLQKLPPVGMLMWLPSLQPPPLELFHAILVCAAGMENGHVVLLHDSCIPNQFQLSQSIYSARLVARSVRLR